MILSFTITYHQRGLNMKVKDVMEPLRNWLNPEMTILEAIRAFKETKRGNGLPVNGMVVLDNDMNLAGIVSSKDIMRLLIPSSIYDDEHHHLISWEDQRRKKTAEASSINVRAIMTEDVRAIRARESLLRCADMIITEGVQRLPVTRSDGKIAGVVYSRDVYNALTELLTH